MAGPSQYNIDYFRVTFPAEYVAHVEINRPEKLNAFRPEMWGNLRQTFDRISSDPNVRVVLLSGAGEKAFSAGLDVAFAQTSGPVSQADAGADTARRATAIRRHIYDYQDAVTAVERCEKPVIALLNGYAYGAAIDISTACCIRYCSTTTRFSVKEVDLGLAADVGTLARLPNVGVSLSWAKEVCYSAREFGAEEAARVGLVSRVLADKAALVRAGLELAVLIAGKSPVAVQGTKALVDYTRGRTIGEALQMTAVWNAGMLQTRDVADAMAGALQKGKKTRFEKL